MKIVLPAKEEMQEIMEINQYPEVFIISRYYSILKSFYIKRLKIILKFLGNKKYNNLLDVGFGGGIFFPALQLKCNNLFGLDSHNYINQVSNFLIKKNISAQLTKGSVTSLPYKDSQFDVIISLSVLEFVEKMDLAISEISRVTKPGGRIVIGAPINNKITDFCYNLIGRKTQNQNHASDHIKIIEAIKKYLTIEKIKTIPFFTPLNYSLFFIVSATKK